MVFEVTIEDDLMNQQKKSNVQLFVLFRFVFLFSFVSFEIRSPVAQDSLKVVCSLGQP